MGLVPTFWKNLLTNMKSEAILLFTDSNVHCRRIRSSSNCYLEIGAEVVLLKLCTFDESPHPILGSTIYLLFNVTGPPGALLFDVKPEIALKESLELQF